MMTRFWCYHKHQTSPRRDEHGEYCRCLDCGCRVPWSWGDQSLLQPPRMLQPRRLPSRSPMLPLAYNSNRKLA